MMQSKQDAKPLNTQRIFEALEVPLGLIEDSERREELRRFVAAAKVHQERAIFDVLSEMVAAANEAAATNLRLEYKAGSLQLVFDSVGAEQEAETAFRSDEDIERVTVRLPRRLKELIDEAARSRGLSVNSWYVRTLARSIFHQMRDRIGAEPGGRWPGRRGSRRPRGLSSLD